MEIRYAAGTRLTTVSAGPDTTTYNYEADSTLLAGATTKHNSTTASVMTRAHDALDRLVEITTSNGTATVSSHSYIYDTLNHRTKATLANGDSWHYAYDDMGQVVSAEKKHSSNAVYPGMNYAYAFDGIGNRTETTTAGKSTIYTNNKANQITEREVPGVIDILGSADMQAKVTVNLEPTMRLREFFHGQVEVDNSTAPQYPDVTIRAVKNEAGPDGKDLQGEVSGHYFLPKSPETYTYDGEGNILSDGRWNYTWDAENRLIKQETLATIPDAAKRKLEFVYDSQSRRIRKTVSNWNSTTNSWDQANDTLFLYDGWNLIAELDAGNSNVVLRTYLWGLDLSGTPQGAGGVGGLLSIQTAADSYLPVYDGNGNIMALIEADDQSTVARYEYGAFGETLLVEEPEDVSNPFRFSTKYRDTETGHYYYGYRYYNPETGKLLSRDPLEEEGGANLYGFVGNDSTNHVDYLGTKAKLFTQNPWAMQMSPNDVRFGSTQAQLNTDRRRFQAFVRLRVPLLGEKVVITGQYDMYITYKKSTTVSQSILLQHERKHAEISKDNWNKFVTDANPFEGWYCSPCGSKIAKYLNK